jgi:hypothetical protein
MMPADPKLIEAIILACLERNPIDFRKVDDAEVKKVQTAIKRATTEKGTGFRYPVTGNIFFAAASTAERRKASDRRLWIPLR